MARLLDTARWCLLPSLPSKVFPESKIAVEVEGRAREGVGMSNAACSPCSPTGAMMAEVPQPTAERPRQAFDSYNAMGAKAWRVLSLEGSNL